MASKSNLAAKPAEGVLVITEGVRELVETVCRSESRRIFATLIRLLHDFDLAEDALHEASKELIAGYTLIHVNSREEAIEWTKRFPNPAVDGREGEIEVRQLFELEDFGPSEAIERFRDMGIGTKK